MSKKPAQNDTQPGLTVYPGDATPGGVPAKRRAPQLHNIWDVADFQATLIRQVYRGELDPDLAGKLTFMLNGLRASLDLAGLEYLAWVINERLTEAVETQQTKNADKKWGSDQRFRAYLENLSKRIKKAKLSR